MDYMPTPKQVDFMAHAMCPVVGKVDQQEKRHPVEPSFLQFKEGEVGKENLINSYSEYFKKQTWKLGSYSAAEVGDGIGESIEFAVWKTFYGQLNSYQQEKNRDWKNNGIQIQSNSR